MKKIIAFLLSACLAIGVLGGCGGKEVKADEFVLAVYKLVIMRDSKPARDIGIAESEIKSFEEAYDKAKTDGINAQIKTYSDKGIELDKEVVTNFYDSYFKALTKLTATATVESSKDSEATVKISSTYIDMGALSTKALEAATAKLKASDYSEQLDYTKELFKEFFKIYGEELEKYEPGKETQSATVTVKKNKGSWTYTDSATFSKAMTDLSVKQAS